MICFARLASQPRSEVPWIAGTMVQRQAGFAPMFRVE